MYFVFMYFVLMYSVLMYSVLMYSVLMYSVLMYSVHVRFQGKSRGFVSARPTTDGEDGCSDGPASVSFYVVSWRWRRKLSHHLVPRKVCWGLNDSGATGMGEGESSLLNSSRALPPS
jgi:hypothetical protein